MHVFLLWRSQRYENSVLRLAQEIVRVQEVQVLRRKVEGGNKRNCVKVFSVTVVTTGRCCELNWVWLPLQLLLVSRQKLQVPNVIQNDSVMLLAGKVAHSIGEAVKTRANS